MSKTDRKYYKWKDSESNFEIKLGMEKSKLLSSNTVTEIIANDELYYEGKSGYPWRINFKDDKVEQIWFNGNCTVNIKSFDISEAEMEIGVAFLNCYFEEIPELNKGELSLNEYDKSDVLYIVYRDFFIRLIAIIRKNGGH